MFTSPNLAGICRRLVDVREQFEGVLWRFVQSIMLSLSPCWPFLVRQIKLKKENPKHFFRVWLCSAAVQAKFCSTVFSRSFQNLVHTSHACLSRTSWFWIRYVSRRYAYICVVWRGALLYVLFFCSRVALYGLYCTHPHGRTHQAEMSRVWSSCLKLLFVVYLEYVLMRTTTETILFSVKGSACWCCDVCLA